MKEMVEKIVSVPGMTEEMKEAIRADFGFETRN